MSKGACPPAPSAWRCISRAGWWCSASPRGSPACRFRKVCFFFQAEDGIRDIGVTGVQTCALPISEGDKRQIKKEINEMINAYSDITNNTEFNGVKLFSHGQVDKLGEKLDKIGKPMQIGSQAGENMDFEFFDLGIEKVGVREEVNEVLKVKKGMSLKDLKSDEILKDPKFIDKA